MQPRTGRVDESVATTARLPPRHQCTDSQFDDWVADVTERADPFMSWLGVVFALLVGYEIAVELSPGAALSLEIAGWAIWAAFALEFTAKLWLAPRRMRFLRRHWWQVVLLAVPMLRVLRFLRLVRLGRALPAARVASSSYRAVGTAGYLLRSRLGYLVGVSSVAAIAVAELAYLFERDHPDGIFPSFGDAVIWAVSTVAALQGDPMPSSTGARLVMLAGFLVGLVVVASLAGVVGAYLVEERRERAGAGR